MGDQIRFRTVLTCFVVGKPRPQPQRRLNPKTNTYFFPHDADDWKKTVKKAAEDEIIQTRREFPVKGPVQVTLHFRFPRLKRLTFYGRVPHDNTPDIDNLEKAVLDALSHAGVWMDDRQVCCKMTTKVWCGKGEPAGLYITLGVVQ